MLQSKLKQTGGLIANIFVSIISSIFQTKNNILIGLQAQSEPLWLCPYIRALHLTIMTCFWFLELLFQFFLQIVIDLSSLSDR